MVNIQNLCVVDRKVNTYLSLSDAGLDTFKQALAPYDIRFYTFSLFEFASMISLKKRISIYDVIERIESYIYVHDIVDKCKQAYQYWFLNSSEFNAEAEAFLHKLSMFKNIAASNYMRVLNECISKMDRSTRLKFEKIENYIEDCEKRRKLFKFKPVQTYKIEIGKNCYGFNNSIIGVADKKVHPNGLCDFSDKKIYLNTEALSKRMSSSWSKHYVKHVYYHEMAHAMDYGYCKYNLYSEHSLKLTCSSYESNFRQTVLKNHIQYKKIRSRNRFGKYLDYFHGYRVFEECPESFECYLNGHNEFGHLNKDGSYVDTSQAQIESFAECMAFLVRYMTEGFNDFDLYRLKQKYSYERVLMKSLINSLYYLAHAVDWTIFNLNRMQIRKKKRELLEYLSVLESSPVYFRSDATWGSAGRVKPKKIQNIKVLKAHLYR